MLRRLPTKLNPVRQGICRKTLAAALIAACGLALPAAAQTNSKDRYEPLDDYNYYSRSWYDEPLTEQQAGADLYTVDDDRGDGVLYDDYEDYYDAVTSDEYERRNLGGYSTDYYGYRYNDYSGDRNEEDESSARRRSNNDDDYYDFEENGRYSPDGNYSQYGYAAPDSPNDLDFHDDDFAEADRQQRARNYRNRSGDRYSGYAPRNQQNARGQTARRGAPRRSVDDGGGYYGGYGYGGNNSAASRRSRTPGLTGQVLATRQVNRDGDTRQLARIRTNNGQTRTVDLGPADELDELNLRRGSRISMRTNARRNGTGRISTPDGSISVDDTSSWPMMYASARGTASAGYNDRNARNNRQRDNRYRNGRSNNQRASSPYPNERNTRSNRARQGYSPYNLDDSPRRRDVSSLGQRNQSDQNDRSNRFRSDRGWYGRNLNESAYGFPDSNRNRSGRNARSNRMSNNSRQQNDRGLYESAYGNSNRNRNATGYRSTQGRNNSGWYGRNQSESAYGFNNANRNQRSNRMNRGNNAANRQNGYRTNRNQGSVNRNRGNLNYFGQPWGSNASNYWSYQYGNNSAARGQDASGYRSSGMRSHRSINQTGSDTGGNRGSDSGNNSTGGGSGSGGGSSQSGSGGGSSN